MICKTAGRCAKRVGVTSKSLDSEQRDAKSSTTFQVNAQTATFTGHLFRPAILLAAFQCHCYRIQSVLKEGSLNTDYS